MPEVSVIVPVYKVEPYLRRCVDSILAQTFTDFELILVDDGSPDNCGAICDEYAEKDIRIHVIHQENGGAAAARNTGIDWTFTNSASKWIAFIDSDDWVHPNYLDYLYRAVQEENVKISVCGFREVTEKNERFETIKYQYRILPWEELFIKQNTLAIIPCCKLCSKEIFHGLRFPVGKRYEDEFLLYKLISQHANLSLLDGDLYYYYYNSEGVSKQPFSLKRMDAVEAFEERLGYFEKSGNRRVVRYCLNRYMWIIWNTRELLQKAEDIPMEDRMRREKQLKHSIRSTLFRYFPMSWKWMIKSCLKASPSLYGFLRKGYHALRKTK